MVRTKLDLLKQEITHYLGLPYWKNSWSHLVLKQEGPFAGKGTYWEIDQATQAAAEKEHLDLNKLNQSQIYNLRKRNHIGIDCSGLCYHLLNKLDQLNGGQGILYKMTGVDKPFGTLGVRSVSAHELTHPQNSLKIKDYSTIQTGDLIRLNGGKHVIFIIEKKGNIIYYVNTSNQTKYRRVHLAKITIVNPQKSLDCQLWSETLLSRKPYSSLFRPTRGDGIYRPKFLTSLR
jgi:hypothetical protein